MDKMKKTAEVGSLTAKGGFRNEEDVAKKFNSWKQDSYAQAWLFEMGYELKNLTQVKAKVLHSTNRCSGSYCNLFKNSGRRKYLCKACKQPKRIQSSG